MKVKMSRSWIVVAFMVAFGSSAQAQAFRTWVSGLGDDANACSRTTPCKTFRGAIAKTAAGGEVNILDSSGSIGVTERTAYILRVRTLAVKIARAYVEQTQPAVSEA